MTSDDIGDDYIWSTSEKPSGRLRYVTRMKMPISTLGGGACGGITLVNDKFAEYEKLLQQEWEICMTHFNGGKILKYEWRDVPMGAE